MEFFFFFGYNIGMGDCLILRLSFSWAALRYEKVYFLLRCACNNLPRMMNLYVHISKGNIFIYHME